MPTLYSDRISLDRRRLENAHLRFAIISTQKDFPEVFSEAYIKSDVQDTLKEINQNFSLTFRRTYSGINIVVHPDYYHGWNTAHRCSYPGCGSVLVLDGNMKNHRDICSAKPQGHIEFECLPGVITTGWTSTPA